MTILQLQYFQAVYEYRNMTRAANALYVSQPSVSTAIQELEDEFSVKLFLRTKPLQPTQAGQRPPTALLRAPTVADSAASAASARPCGWAFPSSCSSWCSGCSPVALTCPASLSPFWDFTAAII